jgi:hypothetical protein
VILQRSWKRLWLRREDDIHHAESVAVRILHDDPRGFLLSKVESSCAKRALPGHLVCLRGPFERTEIEVDAILAQLLV